jgi:hypothetical protein
VAYQITFLGELRHPNLKGKAVARETAVEAWALIQHLAEIAEIIDPFGKAISWQELRAIATKEAEPDADWT